LQSRNLSKWLERPIVEYVEDYTLRDMFRCSRSETDRSNAFRQFRVTSALPYDCLPPELTKLRPGFEKERLRDLPRVVSYGGLLEVNLSVGVAASYLHTLELRGKIRNTNREDLNDSACGLAFDLDNFGTLWPFESCVHDIVNKVFRRWHRCDQFPKLCDVFSTFGFTPPGSMSYFSASFRIGDIHFPVGVAVEVASSALGHHENQQADMFARQQLIIANLPVLTLVAVSCCHVDDSGNFVYKPIFGAFIYGVAVLDQEVMIE